ncbi:hypothetical protein QW180_16840 [Vibrio sinaloensis]|nr:hypothetical protein [Vibrio sinaloensis]
MSERVRLAEFQEELAKQIEHQNNLETEFRAAVSNGELADFYVVFFSPCMTLKLSKCAVQSV